MDKYLSELFHRTLEACSPQKAVAGAASCEGDVLQIGESRFELDNQPVYVLAVGKAAVPMYQSVHAILDDHITGSLVITPTSSGPIQCSADEVIEGEHPVPGQGSLKAGEGVVAFLNTIPEDALVLSLISGGTSSLMCHPAEGITIEDLNQAFDLLNNSGAGIYEMNAVRKHCSSIKGGQLLRFLPNEISLVNLIISDVPGDDPAVIGSGPTVPDPSTFSDAHDVLQERRIWDNLPESVRKHIQAGINAQRSETLKPGERSDARWQTHIISSAGQFADQAAKFAEEDGNKIWVAEEPFNEPVEIVASDIIGRIEESLKGEGESIPPKVFIFYGESTVNVTGQGKGGRNQELALRGALKIAGRSNIGWLSAGTDGIDGPTDAAGALVGGDTITQARDQNIDPEKYLEDNDAYHFHEKMGTLLKTGPTGNNLMDVVFVKLG